MSIPATAHSLVDQLDEALSNLRVAPVRRQEVADMARQAKALVERIERFEAEVAPLAGTRHSQLTVARDSWITLDPGVYRCGSAELERQTTVSPTLRTLHQAGVSIGSVTRAGPEERKVADRLGAHFDEWSLPWHRLKLSLANRRRCFGYVLSEAEDTIAFMEAMMADGVVADVLHEVYLYSRREWVPATPKRLRHNTNRGQRMRCTFRPVDAELARWLGGQWLTTYVEQIMVDCLVRNGTEYELYTNVEYQAPADIFRARGDFDLVVRAADNLVFVECKSGRLDAARHDFAPIREKALGIRQVLAATWPEVACSSWLVFNHHLSDPGQVAAELEGSDVRPVRIDQVRSALTASLGSVVSPQGLRLVV